MKFQLKIGLLTVKRKVTIMDHNVHVPDEMLTFATVNGDYEPNVSY